MTRPTRQSAAGRAYLDLQNRARREQRGTQELLTMYIVERWLARLSRSDYVDDFILKGGMLLASFGNRRPTVDADALARNLAADEQTVAARATEIAAINDPDDGVEFLADTVTTAAIRDLSQAVGALTDLRTSTYAAYHRRLGPDAIRLPEQFQDVVTAVIAFVDPLIDAPTSAGKWNPETRQWELPKA